MLISLSVDGRKIRHLQVYILDKGANDLQKALTDLSGLGVGTSSRDGRLALAPLSDSFPGSSTWMRVDGRLLNSTVFQRRMVLWLGVG